MGRITGLARPSVPYGRLIENKKALKQKNDLNVLQNEMGQVGAAESAMPIRRSYGDILMKKYVICTYRIKPHYPYLCEF